jgi:ketosteroid isomerase-like protein
MSLGNTALDKLAIGETIENYFNFLDAKDWTRVAACFTPDAQSRYNFEPEVLHSGRGVTDWLQARPPRLGNYGATVHALGNLHIEVKGNSATCDSRVTASLLYEKGGADCISVRAIWYRDKLRREGDRWLIAERVHEPQWQYEVPAQEMRV